MTLVTGQMGSLSLAYNNARHDSEEEFFCCLWDGPFPVRTLDHSRLATQCSVVSFIEKSLYFCRTQSAEPETTDLNLEVTIVRPQKQAPSVTAHVLATRAGGAGGRTHEAGDLRTRGRPTWQGKCHVSSNT